MRILIAITALAAVAACGSSTQGGSAPPSASPAAAATTTAVSAADTAADKLACTRGREADAFVQQALVGADEQKAKYPDSPLDAADGTVASLGADKWETAAQSAASGDLVDAMGSVTAAAKDLDTIISNNGDHTEAAIAYRTAMRRFEAACPAA